MDGEVEGRRVGRLNGRVDGRLMDRRMLALALSPPGHGRLEILVQILLQIPLTLAAASGSAESPWGTAATLDPVPAPRGAAGTQDRPLCPHAGGFTCPNHAWHWDLLGVVPLLSPISQHPQLSTHPAPPVWTQLHHCSPNWRELVGCHI